jgi:glutamate carboxypeptidase
MNDIQDLLTDLENQREAMIELLVQWSETNSGSGSLGDLERMLKLLELEFDRLDGDMRRIDLSPMETVTDRGELTYTELGQALSIRKRPEAPLRIFLCIHYDTVFGPDHPFQSCTRSSDNRLSGPGTADAKGGIVVMLKALEILERSSWAEALGWEVLLTPDEELGSPGSASLLADAARRNHVGLVFEPALPDGSLVGDRKGSGNFTVTVHGRSAHAGRDPETGRNAIHAMAELITDLNAAAASEPGIIVNVGRISGGGPVNMVPELAVCRLNVRVTDSREQSLIETTLQSQLARLNARDGMTADLHGGFARPPKQVDDRTDRLHSFINECGRELGLVLQRKPSGGACDGNILSAAGLPVVDSLGVCGGNLHTGSEYVLIDTLIERAKLTALVLLRSARDIRTVMEIVR